MNRIERILIVGMEALYFGTIVGQMIVWFLT